MDSGKSGRVAPFARKSPAPSATEIHPDVWIVQNGSTRKSVVQRHEEWSCTQHSDAQICECVRTVRSQLAFGKAHPRRKKAEIAPVPQGGDGDDRFEVTRLERPRLPRTVSVSDLAVGGRGDAA